METNGDDKWRSSSLMMMKYNSSGDDNTNEIEESTQTSNQSESGDEFIDTEI